MRIKTIATMALLLLLSAALCAGEEKDNGKISGLVFGDAYWVAANHDPGIQDQNGFWIRRIYFTYDRNLSQDFSMRFRLEANSAGDFTTKATLEPKVKDAYLKWKSGRHSLLAGISPSPTWNFVENAWGYRWVEKTPLDLYKFGSSRDFGLAAQGSLDAAKKVNYHLMIGNGNGESTESNKGKKFMGSLRAQLGDYVTLEGYGDFDDRPGRTDRYTGQGFLTFAGDSWRAGVLFAHQTRRTNAGSDLQLQVGSVFAAARLGNKVWAIARVDRQFDPNPDAEGISYLPFASAARSTLIIAGLDIAPVENVRLSPNVEIIAYDVAGGAAPDSDVMPRLTFFYQWK